MERFKRAWAAGQLFSAGVAMEQAHTALQIKLSAAQAELAAVKHQYNEIMADIDIDRALLGGDSE